MIKHKMIKATKKKEWIFISILSSIFNISLYSQDLLNRFDSVYCFYTEEASIIKVSTKNDSCSDGLFFFSYSDLKHIPIFRVNKENVIIDSIPNVKIDLGGSVYNPFIRSMFYDDGNLYFFYGYGIAKAEKKGDDWLFENYYNSNTEEYIQKYDRIIGVFGQNVVLANDIYYKNSPNRKYEYTIGLYDTEKNNLIKEITIDCGRGILLNTFSFFNLFTVNERYISFIDPIAPKVYLYNKDLELVDTIVFQEQNSYSQTRNKLKELFTDDFLSVSMSSPKNLVFPLYENIINIKKGRYGMNIKQKFIGDNELVVVCLEVGEKSQINIFRIDLVNKKSEKIATLFDVDGFYSSLVWSEELPVFGKDIYVRTTKNLTLDEENIKFGFDVYNIDSLNLFSK